MTVKKLSVLRVSSIFALLGTALIAHTQYADGDSVPLTIEAQGRGDVRVKPDSAIIRLSVVRRALPPKRRSSRMIWPTRLLLMSLWQKRLFTKTP